MWLSVLLAVLVSYLLGNLNGAVCMSQLIAHEAYTALSFSLLHTGIYLLAVQIYIDSLIAALALRGTVCGHNGGIHTFKNGIGHLLDVHNASPATAGVCQHLRTTLTGPDKRTGIEDTARCGKLQLKAFRIGKFLAKGGNFFPCDIDGRDFDVEFSAQRSGFLTPPLFDV